VPYERAFAPHTAGLACSKTRLVTMRCGARVLERARMAHRQLCKVNWHLVQNSYGKPGLTPFAFAQAAPHRLRAAGRGDCCAIAAAGLTVTSK
jgi:hypothetical protein